VGNPASVQQASSKWPTNTCRSVLSTGHDSLVPRSVWGAWLQRLSGRRYPARLFLTLKFQPKQTPLGLAGTGRRERGGGGANFGGTRKK
jgi:hypothetical protein